MNNTTDKTQAQTIEDLVNNVGFQLEELDTKTHDVLGGFENVIKVIKSLDDSTLSDEDKKELIGSVKWELGDFFNEIGRVATDIMKLAQFTGEIMYIYEDYFEEPVQYDY